MEKANSAVAYTMKKIQSLAKPPNLTDMEYVRPKAMAKKKRRSSASPGKTKQ
jgi:hypothetical protein